MTIPGPRPILAVRDVLRDLGFEEDRDAFTDNPPAYSFKRGNLELGASEVMNRFLQPCFFFGGLWRTPRSLKMIDFEMPLKVESYEQAVAWICYGIGIDFEPSVWIGWFDSGKKWQGTLPWERYYRELKARSEENRRLRALRPHCFVSRKWMRVLLNHMTDTIDGDAPELKFRIRFDGRMLKLELPKETIGAPATGPGAWPSWYWVTVTPKVALPKRLATDPVELGIWEDVLEIERSQFRAAEDL